MYQVRFREPPALVTQHRLQIVGWICSLSPGTLMPVSGIGQSVSVWFSR